MEGRHTLAAWMSDRIGSLSKSRSLADPSESDSRTLCRFAKAMLQSEPELEVQWQREETY